MWGRKAGARFRYRIYNRGFPRIWKVVKFENGIGKLSYIIITV